MSGGGIGGTLGSVLGAALAPETGGLSLAIPALAGAAGAGLGGALTGSKNPLMDALMGGVASGIGGGLAGDGTWGGLLDSGAVDGAEGAGASLGSIGGDLGGIGSEGTGGVPSLQIGNTGQSGFDAALGNGMPSLSSQLGPSVTDTPGASITNAMGMMGDGYGAPAFPLYSGADSIGADLGSGAAADIGNAAADAGNAGTASILSGGGSAAGSAANPSYGSQIASFLGRQAEKNPLNLVLAGGSILSGAQSLLPHKKVNIGQNAADVMATNPNFNAQLPQYSMQNTATPYAGDWYKYGQTPQPVMYNAQPQLLAKGGMVKGYAQGGMPPQNPLGAMPPQAMGNAPPQANPLVLKAAHAVGVQIGQHLKKHSPVFTGHGKVGGDSGGQDDAVPARLSSGEFVVPADVVGHLGDGSSDAGAKKLTEMMGNVRKQKSGSGFPKKSKKNPLNYVKGA
jgi:hypothetical protein